ncbi:YlbL family protein [Demequina activiva]|uniref:YlbL family protein n=1 Tax=Demequina activiva TaxID=1582364 RepID=UPI00194545EF|nr:PDZ domain-containing protein [Demequina activiva]
MTLPPERSATVATPQDSGATALDAGDREPAPDDLVPTDRRTLVMSVCGLGGAILVAVLSVLPASFALGGPGPTFDTLAQDDGVPTVEISGAPTFPASGELRLTTVTVARTSETPFTLGRVLRDWASPSAYVTPEEEVFGTPDQEDEFEEQSQQAWITSQEAATVAALEALGEPVPATLTVAEVDETSDALGVLEPGDVITGVDGAEVGTFTGLSDAVGDRSPGADITVDYLRGGEQQEATFGTLDDGFGEAIMGIWIDPQFDLPVDVSVNVAEVSGPSAGLMFSLSIMDQLTEIDELGGAKVAGTGTISAAGDVGPIGGIRMKMYGARDAGSSSFLAPVENCGEVAGNVPDGLDVFSVDTLDDAYAAITAIGAGDTSALATCEAP